MECNSVGMSLVATSGFVVIPARKGKSLRKLIVSSADFRTADWIARLLRFFDLDIPHGSALGGATQEEDVTMANQATKQSSMHMKFNDT